MSSYWPCFKYRYSCSHRTQAWPEASSQALLALHGSASPQGSLSPIEETAQIHLTLLPQQPAHPIPSPHGLLWACVALGASGTRVELCELEELGSSCTGSNFCLGAKPRDPQSLSSSIPLLRLSKKHFTECLKKAGWPRDRRPSSAATYVGAPPGLATFFLAM